MKGYKQRDIASTMKIPLTIVNEDLQHMRAEANENIRHYIDEWLPTEYQNCLDILDLIIKEMWELKTVDNRELMQSRQLIKECYAMRIELVGSTAVVDKAIRFIQRQQDLGRGLTPQNDKVVIDHGTVQSRSK
jgi:hypothetical protein